MSHTNVVKMDEWIPSEVPGEERMRTEAENQDMVMLLKFLLQEAENGNLDGFTGAFLIASDGDDDRPAVGMVASNKMEDFKYTTIGALEKIKAGLLA